MRPGTAATILQLRGDPLGDKSHKRRVTEEKHGKASVLANALRQTFLYEK